MSESNIELARHGFEAVAGGDFDALRDLLDPDVKWHGSEGPGSDSCHNRDEALHFMRQARNRGVVAELVEIIDAGDQVVVVMRAHRTGRRGASELRANLATFRDRKVVRMVAYESPEAALAATYLVPDSRLDRDRGSG